MNNEIFQQHQGLAKLGLDDVDARVLIVGMGVTGLSVVRFLSSNHIKVAIVDSRNVPPGLQELEEHYHGLAVFTGGFHEDTFAAATHLIVSPGISLQEPEIVKAAQRGVSIIGDIDIFAVCADAPVACITGSNGKSTVTTLLGHMADAAGLDVRVGGNLGTAALDLITDVRPDLYVLELSSFQLERTSYLKATAATVLNISADHMDRYVDMPAYAQAKAIIFNGDGCAILNRADALVMAMQGLTKSSVTFGLDAPLAGQYGVATNQHIDYLAKGEQRVLPVADLKVRGSHNIENALAAMALADVLDISILAQKKALTEFKGLAHRTQWVRELDKVVWINDSKATNPGATLAAIEGLKGPIVLIAGGDGKGANFDPLRDAIKAHVVHVVLIGKDAERFRQQAVAGEKCSLVESIEDAVELASTLANEGDTVLLSPACASLDQFANYQQRGDRFMAAIARLVP